jgi:hypothetical protein
MRRRRSNLRGWRSDVRGWDGNARSRGRDVRSDERATAYVPLLCFRLCQERRGDETNGCKRTSRIRSHDVVLPDDACPLSLNACRARKCPDAGQFS